MTKIRLFELSEISFSFRHLSELEHVFLKNFFQRKKNSNFWFFLYHFLNFKTFLNGHLFETRWQFKLANEFDPDLGMYCTHA